MGLSFLAPLFFAGLGAILLPYLIHQIRRPEREPMPFSSVLFIPNIPKQVIERKRIQHLLLMLLRMLLLILLALAFSRPYWRALAATDRAEGPTHHLILLDTSFSMDRGGLFENAKSEARGVLRNVNPGDRVGVFAFGQTVRPLSRLYSESDTEGGTVELARRAIDTASLTSEGTDFVNALRAAQRELALPSGDDDTPHARRVLYVISDFQRTGMPERHGGWKLAADIELEPIAVTVPVRPNLGISDAIVRNGTKGDFRVVGKVKNWSQVDVEDRAITLTINGEQRASKTVSVQGGNATQVSFLLDGITADRIEGWLELSQSDAIVPDNRRHFVWHQPRKDSVLIVAETDTGVRWPAQRFFLQALPPIAGLPWEPQIAPVVAIDQYLAPDVPAPDALILCDVTTLENDLAERVLEYVANGGQALITLNEGLTPEVLNQQLLAQTGVRAVKNRFETPRETQFDLMSWVDLNHQIFLPFQGTRFNDFSVLRFFNYVELEVPESSDDVHVLARFDSESPAIVELNHGDGRMILWPFAVRLDWTNLPKTARFVPIFHETLAYLSGVAEKSQAWTVGHIVVAEDIPVGEDGTAVVQTPASDAPETLTAGQLAESGGIRLAQPGFYRAKTAEAPEWSEVAAVNVDPAEGNLNTVDLAEFELKLAAAPVLDQSRAQAGVVGANLDSEGYIIEEEYGRDVLIVLFLLLILESWYMCFLKH